MNFPQLSAIEMQARLAPPSDRVRLAIDTDCANEIDDQFALAWALLSPDQLEIEGIYAAPFSFRIFAEAIARAYELMQLSSVENEADQRLVERFHSRLAALVRQGITPSDVHYDGPEVGMERSYHEILKVYELLGMAPGAATARGAPSYKTSTTTPMPSAAAEHFIECALRADERPLYVAAIGCVTNVASAILMAPGSCGASWCSGLRATLPGLPARTSIPSTWCRMCRPRRFCSTAACQWSTCRAFTSVPNCVSHCLKWSSGCAAMVRWAIIFFGCTPTTRFSV